MKCLTTLNTKLMAGFCSPIFYLIHLSPKHVSLSSKY